MLLRGNVGPRNIYERCVDGVGNVLYRVAVIADKLASFGWWLYFGVFFVGWFAYSLVIRHGARWSGLKFAFFLTLGVFCFMLLRGIIFRLINVLFLMLRTGGKVARRFQKYKPAIRPEGFSLWMGLTTGTLSSRSHAAGMAPGQEVFLSLQDATQNIVTIGGIGSGKTTRVMQPVLVQLLQQDCGGLIFDVKGDFKNAVYKLAEEHGGEIITIGVHQRGLNLLKGLTPEMSASFLKSAFFLAGSGSGDKFWIDTATELCKNSLGVLYFIPGAYSLEALYRYLFFETERDTFTAGATERLSELDTKQTRLLLSYMKYHEVVFSAFDDKVKQGVLATVAQVLSPFQHPDLVDAFCTDHEGAANMESVLSGDIYLVDLPLATWGLGGKAVYTFIKLRFFNVLQARSSRDDLDRERPVFFVCDEYQDIISANKAGLSDLNFWDKSRSARCIGIISAQSISSFRSAIGDRTLADTVLQNFRQKVFFRTEDLETVNYMNQLSGRVEVQRVSQSHNVGVSSSTGSFNIQDQESSGTSTGWTERPTVDAQLIRQLGPDQAIVFFNIDGHAMDDVVYLVPVFVG